MIRRSAKLPLKLVRGLRDAILSGGREDPPPIPRRSSAPSPAPAEAPLEAPAAAADSSSEIYSEATPNPNAMKFVLDCSLVEGRGSLSLSAPEEAEPGSPAEALLQLEGVLSLFAVQDFVTITKDSAADWSDLHGAILPILQRWAAERQ